jgi:hypothetical protein
VLHARRLEWTRLLLIHVYVIRCPLMSTFRSFTAWISRLYRIVNVYAVYDTSMHLQVYSLMIFEP